ncbi:MAG: type II toxin-antitoxin system ParD family antitoxin [Blastomonas sp.]|jgi:antitoxin ParD1/3/4|nr:type II toxin-antitoxin system ParD family antitoxin [Blastomonas sp.]
MSKNTSIALGAPFQEFARRKVESGEYGSTSEVVREAMRRLMADELRLEALRAAIQEGIDSGPAEPLSFDDFIAEMKAPAKDADAA